MGKNIQLRLCTYLNSHLFGAPREYVLHGLDPGLNWASRCFPFPSIFLGCSGPHSVLLFAPTDQVSHSTPSLLTRRLLTHVQVNNMAVLHDTCTDTHIYITLILLFFLFFILLLLPLAGRLAQTLLVWHTVLLLYLEIHACHSRRAASGNHTPANVNTTRLVRNRGLVNV